MPSRARHNKAPGHARKRASRVNELVRPGMLSSTPGVLQPVFPLRGSLSNHAYPVIQTTATPVTITSSTLATTYGNVNFILNLLDQYTSFTAVFDQYRFRMVEVVFRPRVIPVSAATNTGLLATVIDFDDSTNLASFAQAEDYENVMVGKGDESQRRTLIPHAALAAYSGVFTSFANVQNQWLDAASAGVIHYGIKTAWTATDVAYTTDITVRYWIEFRNVR